jgi:hypothetical protein
MRQPGTTILRLCGFWIFTAIVAGGCSAGGRTEMEKTQNALTIAGIAGALIATLVLLAYLLSSFKTLRPSFRGAIVGCFFGLILAAVVMRRIPLETQLVAIGAILGLGADFVSTLKDPSGPNTVINRLAKMISGMITGVSAAATDSGLNKPPEQVIAGGLWSCLGTILFTLVIGNLF